MFTMDKILAILTLLVSISIIQINTCNEAVCGSVVSKCLLINACNCDFVNCTCCKDCASCLGSLYVECCSCLDLCPNVKDEEDELSKKSNVEEFTETVPGLFQLLTDFPDDLSRWNSLTFPIDIDTTGYLPKKELKVTMQSAEHKKMIKNENIITLNCTVAFWSQCLSWTKCKNSCQSMGAQSYRWFHDGCCECVGQSCVNYGLNESKCSECNNDGNETFEKDIEEDELDYGDFENYKDYID